MNRNIRLAVAYTFGQTCAIGMVEARGAYTRNSAGDYVVGVQDPLPADFEALSDKMLDPTPKEIAEFKRGYFEQLIDLLVDRI